MFYTLNPHVDVFVTLKGIFLISFISLFVLLQQCNIFKYSKAWSEELSWTLGEENKTEATRVLV